MASSRKQLGRWRSIDADVDQSDDQVRWVACSELGSSCDPLAFIKPISCLQTTVFNVLLLPWLWSFQPSSLV